MKNLMKLMAATLVLGLAGTATAQPAPVSAAVNASAVVFCPLSVVSAGNLAFGNVIAGVGTAVISDANPGVESYTGAADPGAGNHGTGAGGNMSFTVTGPTGFGYSMTVPASITANGPSGATLLVNNLTWSAGTPSGSNVITGLHLSGSVIEDGNCGGSNTSYMGGTLNILSGSVSGNYTGTANVTVQYQ